MRIETATLAALATMFASAAANATPSARLVYSRARGAESCPDEQALRSAVAARVGYDPFFPWAKQTVVAAMAPEGSGFGANVSLVDEQGVDHGTRTLRTQGACRELVDVVALAIAIAIDPRSLVPHPAPAASAPVEEPTAPPAAPRATPPTHVARAARPPAPVATPTTFEGTVGAVVSEGVAIPMTLGAAFGIGIQKGHVSLAIEGRADVPETVSAPQGSVSSELFAVSLLPCLHLGPVFGCALGQLGRQNDRSEAVPGVTSKWSNWVAAGGRVGVEVPLQSSLGVRVRSDIAADLSRRSLKVDGITDFWVAPKLATSLGIDAVVHFP